MQRRLIGLVSLAVLCAIAAPGAQTQAQYELLHAFESRGSGATAITHGTDGDLYGITHDGGHGGGGTVFRISSAGGIFTLHEFDDPTLGQYPQSAMAQAADGAFYGTTDLGPNSFGTIFRITAAGEFTLAHAFDYSDGYTPTTPLVAGRDGAVYGVSEQGGSGAGTLFKLAPGGSFSVLHAFNYDDGANPKGALVQGADDAWYGTTQFGGPNGAGVIFRITSDGTYEILHAFSDVDGAYPIAALTQSISGDFYGATPYGGSTGSGTIFRIATDGTFTLLHDFNGTDGDTPEAGVTETAGGSIYGVTRYGGEWRSGTVFTIAADGTFTSLHSFSGNDGEEPLSTLTVADNGSLYGTTSRGGEQHGGTIFKVDSGLVVTVHSVGELEGRDLRQPLIRGANGILYGASDSATVFAVSTADDTFQLIASLEFYAGQNPIAPLVEGPDGSLYGTTMAGGTFGAGIIFKMTSDGAFVPLYSFKANEHARPFGLTSGPDGVYGVTIQGGQSQLGTIYRVTPSGEFSTLHEFDYTNGGFPWFRLTRGPDAAFYGVAAIGGTSDRGGVFRISDEGQFTFLYSFTDADGRAQFGGLTVGADGLLYGANSHGGPADAGAIYRISTDGVFSLLHTFDGVDGKWPYAAPVSGSDGAVYGTTARGGASNAGTVYRVAADGSFQFLHEFNRVDGEEPTAPLVLGPGGALYGVTFGNMGSINRGTAFKVTASTFDVVHTFTGPDGGDLSGELVATPTSLIGTAVNGGDSDQGTIFSITSDGTFEILHSGSNDSPGGALLMASDGALYGAAGNGGPSNGGVIFRLTVPAGDTTPPTIVAHAITAANVAGWYNSDVVITFTCDDGGGSGIPAGACPADQILSAEGDSVASTSATVTDAAGNVSAPSNVVVLQIDKTAPTLAPTVGPLPVILNGAASVQVGAADSGSGVDQSSCDAVATNSVGTKSVTCTVVDRAGNTATATASYSVIYRFEGFQQPINDPANTSCGTCPQSVFKAGSTIPAIVRLKDANGITVQSSVTPAWLPPVQIGASSADINESVVTVDGMSGSTYQRVGDQYLYLWKTAPQTHRTIWRIGARLDDGRTYTVDIAVK